ncbi:substrate-binding domain-containing protein [Amycolatopsis endophytica]
MLVLLAGAGWVAADLARDGSGCAKPVVVRVAAAPGVASAIAQVARRVAQTECAAFEVNAVDSAAVAQSLAGAVRPDVWVPESTLQLRRARGVGAGEVAAGTSIASSPVVFALTEQAATALGWPGRTPTWADVLGDTAVSLGVPDPGRDPAGLSALIGIRAALPSADAYAAALRRLSPNALSTTDELFTRLTDPAQPVSGFPVSENALLRHNLRDSVAGAPDSLVATYQAQTPALDYPFAVLGGAGEAQRAAAGALRSALLGLEGINALADAGFRTPDGRYLRDGTARNVSDRTQPSPEVPTDADVDALLGQWARVNTSSRARVLIDVSGSMNQVVPGSGGQTRMQLTTDAAARALALFKPTSESSVWEFATRLDGDRDYREVLPMRPVSEQLVTGAAERLRAITADPDGDTGLYDTVLAAYRLAGAEWQPGRLNLVIVLTDGRNDDAGGISRDALVTELAKLADPARPVAIVGIGIGPDIDMTELAAITTPTGGQAFAAPDAARITDVFYGALARLSGT